MPIRQKNWQRRGTPILLFQVVDSSKLDEDMETFWRSKPFRIVEGVMDQILNHDADENDGMLLEEISTTTPIKSSSSSSSIDKFTQFYTGNWSRHVPSNITSRWFRLDIAYNGSAFQGWQRQSRESSSVIPTVQLAIQDKLQATFHRHYDLPPVGRTDAGVHAAALICRLRLEKNATAISPDHVYQSLLQTTPTRKWKCLAVSAAPKEWHPTFQATSRSYLYIMDLDTNFLQLYQKYRGRTTTTTCNDLQVFVRDANDMLERLRGRELCYYSYSIGKPKDTGCNCTLTHARARLLLQQPTQQQEGESPALCLAIELTGNRFLRRMVRILVATLVRNLLLLLLEDDKSSDGQVLLTLDDLCTLQNRNLTAKAAPPNGLILLGADFRN